MSSFAIRNNDLCVEGGKFVIDPTLESEVRVVLAIDRRSTVGSDATGSAQSGGYWADPNIGTLLWTRLGMKNNSETHRLIERDISEGLAYMVTERRITDVRVVARQGTLPGTVEVDITLRRGDEVVLNLRAADLWAELGFPR